MSEFLPEIIVHLDSPRVDLRTEAAVALLHLVDRDATIEIGADGLSKIFACFMDENSDLSSASSALLTNLLAGMSDVITAVDPVMAFQQCVKKVKKGTVHTNTFLMFLSNLTLNEPNCTTIFESDDAVVSIRDLLELFLDYNPQSIEFDGITNFDDFDVYQHAGSFICNMSRLEPFRNLICGMEHPYLPKFFDQVRSLAGLLLVAAAQISASLFR